MVGAGGSEEYAVAMKDLTHQIERACQPFTAATRDAHSPRHLSKTEFLGKASGKTRVGEIVGEKAIVLCR